MISKEDIIKVASLSRLSLSEKEIGQYQQEFTNILGFFDTLSEVNTDGVKATAQITGLENITTEDVVDSFSSEKLLECSLQSKVKTQVAVAAVM